MLDVGAKIVVAEEQYESAQAVRNCGRKNILHPQTLASIHTTVGIGEISSLSRGNGKTGKRLTSSPSVATSEISLDGRFAQSII